MMCKHGNFQMKMYDIVFLFFFALKHRSRVHISRILLLVLIELRHKKAWPEVIKLFHV